ncbi:hypothetical protein Pla110_11510 [Polystyrenella longa]|uniref:Globin family profile domain-containing protein n=1 Tax=Polystyrenella longa TaxID=2528007 RepID=A0A518CJP0_9PLAN|nr:globin [Polystyrenella longa]QDU79441.1 hypothetical protein Pla110_11510 [Polystyrenella longa]
MYRLLLPFSLLSDNIEYLSEIDQIMMKSTPLSEETALLVHDSYRRCMLASNFLPLFHQKMIGSSKEVAKYFDVFPVNQRYRILAKSVAELVSFAEKKPEAIQQMNEVARLHSREKLRLKPEFYTFWSSSFMETISELDDQWNDELETAWTDSISHGIEYLIQKNSFRL